MSEIYGPHCSHDECGWIECDVEPGPRGDGVLHSCARRHTGCPYCGPQDQADPLPIPPTVFTWRCGYACNVNLTLRAASERTLEHAAMRYGRAHMVRCHGWPKERTDPGPEQLLVAPGTAAPRDDRGEIAYPMRTGDVLRVSCAKGVAEVVEATDEWVTLRWPWQDPGWHTVYGEPYLRVVHTVKGRAGGFGQGAPVDPYRYRPDPATTPVQPGDRIEVDLPEITVHVSHTETRWPRHSPQPMEEFDFLGTLSYYPYGAFPGGAAIRYGADVRRKLRPWSAAPVTITLVHRPYPALRSGDQVEDADGQRWRFVTPLEWYRGDEIDPKHQDPAGPRWPLSLTARAGENGGLAAVEPGAVEAVAAFTTEGSHQQEAQRWRDASGADLVERPARSAPVRVLSPSAERRERAFQLVREKARDKTADECRQAQAALDDDATVMAGEQRDAWSDVLETLRLTGAERYEGEATEFMRKIVEAAINPRPVARTVWHLDRQDDEVPCACRRQPCGGVAGSDTVLGCPNHRHRWAAHAASQCEE